MSTKTLPKVSDLTDAELCIEIAKEVGYVWRECEYVGKSRCHPEDKKRVWFVDWPLGEYGDYIVRETSKVGRACLGNADEVGCWAFTSDLNLMATAEATLEGIEFWNYSEAVYHLQGGKDPFETMRATAKQRAQAFVVAKGKADL